MTPELHRLIDMAVSKEHHMNLIEQEHMAIDQLEGYPGFKRQHRFNSRWRNESAICLTNYVIDNYGYRPMVTIQFASGSGQATYLDGIQSIINAYEDLKMAYVAIARRALAENLDELMQFSEKKICWITKTKMKYMRDHKESTGKEADYIQLRSERMHEKYRCKEMDFKVGEY